MTRIDFDETGLYKGFVKNVKGQKYPGRNPQLLSLQEVDPLEGFSGIMYPNAVLIDADEQPHNDILQNIVKGEKLACYMTNREGGRGVHVLLWNHNTKLKKADKVMLACGIVVDFHPGYSMPGECLKYNGIERTVIYDKRPYQELPKYFTPLSKCSIDFANMGDGDGRNSTLFSYILSLQNAGFSEEEIKATFQIINKYVLADPLDEKELDVILRDEAFKKQVYFSGSRFSHDKFAERIRSQHHIQKINGRLHLYKGGVYVPGDKEIEQVMLQEVQSLTANQRNEVLKYLDVVCREAPPAAINLIAFKNGIYNVIENQLEPFSPDHIITNPIPWNYNPDAKSDLVDSVLEKISCGDSDIRYSLEELAGACLYRSPLLGGGIAGILTGDKENGKSTYIHMLKGMLGSDNYCTIDSGDLGKRFITTMLHGKLANLGDDISNQYIADPSIFKKLVTGEEVQAEEKGKAPFNFVSYATNIFSANEIPHMKDPTGAMLRRLLIIPFNAKFLKTDPGYDPFIKRKLAKPENMEYFIQCALDGLADVLGRGRFTVPAKAEQQKAEYEVENNPILSFIEEVGKDNIINESASDVYARYKVFCNESGFHPGSNLTFSKNINRLLGTESKQKKIKGRNVKVFCLGSGSG